MVRIIGSGFFVVFLVTVNAQLASQTTPSSYLPSLRNTDPSFTPVVVALCCSFLFVLFFSFYLRQCSDANLAVPSLPVAAAAANYTSPYEPQGIDSKLLDTFPILMYSDLKELKLGGGTTSVPLDCAVCLGEFKHDDILRLLPKCNHVFHPDCIKSWLASHVTCPVCRAVLKPAERRHGEEEEEVAVVIRNNQANEPEEVGDRSARRTTAREVSCGRDGGLRRCHSTGHSLDMRSPTKYEVFEGREDEGSSSQGRLFISE